MSSELEKLSISSDGCGVVLAVKVVPGSSRTQIMGVYGSSLKVKVAAPPEKGKANKELTKFMAKLLGIPASAVLVVSGQSSPQKEIRCQGVSVNAVIAKLAEICKKTASGG